MGLEDYKDFVSSCATITTIAQFLTGITVCQKYIKNGTTGESSSAPFVMGALNACCWFKYGLMIQDTTVILVNFVGATLMSAYTICFYYYCTRRLSLQKQIVSAFSFYVTLNLYLTFGESDASSGRYMCGLVASGFAIGFFASPLATLVHVIRTRSTSTLPYYMILANFLLTAQWFLYGIILDDAFIKIPNFLGWCLATIQLALFFVYPSKLEDRMETISYNGARPKERKRSIPTLP